jgi:hypothetical protein
MKVLSCILTLILFINHTDYYDIDIVENSISVEFEDNNSAMEEYTTLKLYFKFSPIHFYNVLQSYPHFSFFEEIHLDSEINPPELLS